MAKKSMVEREKKRQILSAKFFNIRKELTLKVKEATNFDEKFLYNSLLQKLPRNSSPSRLM